MEGGAVGGGYGAETSIEIVSIDGGVVIVSPAMVPSVLKTVVPSASTACATASASDGSDIIRITSTISVGLFNCLLVMGIVPEPPMTSRCSIRADWALGKRCSTAISRACVVSSSSTSVMVSNDRLN